MEATVLGYNYDREKEDQMEPKASKKPFEDIQ